MDPSSRTADQLIDAPEVVSSWRRFVAAGAAAGVLALSAACGEGDPDQVGRSLLNPEVSLVTERTPEIITKQEYDTARNKAVLDSQQVADLIASSGIRSDRGTNWKEAVDKGASDVVDVIYGNGPALREYADNQYEGDDEEMHLQILVSDNGRVLVQWGVGPEFAGGMEYAFVMARGNPGLVVLDAEQPTAAMVRSIFQNPVWLSLESTTNRADGWVLNSVDALDTTEDDVAGRPWDTTPAFGQDFSSLEVLNGTIRVPEEPGRYESLNPGLVPATEVGVQSLSYAVNHTPQPPTDS